MAYTADVEVYEAETREIIRRYLIEQIGYQDCVAALDAALAGLLPYLGPQQVEKARSIRAANNELLEELREWQSYFATKKKRTVTDFIKASA
jgi:hypothetical protein